MPPRPASVIVQVQKLPSQPSGPCPSRRCRPFRLLELPLELRWEVYRHAVPSGGRILIDPEYARKPLPYSIAPCPDATCLMCVSKAMYAELCEFIYSRNAITVICPLSTKVCGSFAVNPPEFSWRPDLGRYSTSGPPLCEWIRTLELHDQYLDRYGQDGEDEDDEDDDEVSIKDLYPMVHRNRQIVNRCPNLQTLNIVLYHEMQWPAFFVELARYSNEKLRLDLDLYTSVVTRHDEVWQWKHAGRHVQELQAKSIGHSPWYWLYKRPGILRHIVISVSATGRAARELVEWRYPEFISGHFEKVSYQKGPPEMTRVTWVNDAADEDKLKRYYAEDQLEWASESEGVSESG